MPNYGASYGGSAAAAFVGPGYGALHSAAQYQNLHQPLEREVYTEQVTVPQTVTRMVPQTTFQNKTVQVPAWHSPLNNYKY